MEDNPNTDADEQGVDKREALLSSDVSAVDRENIHVEEVDDEASTSSMLNSAQSKIKNWMKCITEKFEDLMIDLTGSTMEGAIASTDRVPCVASLFRAGTLDGIMKALTTSGHDDTIGVLGAPESVEIAYVLEKVSRRAKRDKLFNVVVMATVSNKPNIRKIQDEIAEPLSLKFDDEKQDVAKRAKRLRERILMEQKILVILCDICKGIDLDKIGIPFGTDHTGCKLLLTSASKEVLSNQMHAQKIFNVCMY